jgi:hypothetical protein
MKTLHVLAAAALGLSGSCQAVPAQAFSLGTAAWATARSVCLAMEADISMPESVRLGIAEHNFLWAQEMAHPAFARLMANEVVRQCPRAVQRAVPTQAGRLNL